MLTTHLTDPTLILNKAWQGIDACTARKAICNVLTDRARIVYTLPGPYQFSLHDMDSWLSLGVNEEEPCIKSTSGKMKVPEAILLNDYSKMPKRIVTFSRRNLWKRDRLTCGYCGIRMSSEDATIDHVVPRCQGGISSFTNCVLACITCNKRKNNKTPEQAGMRLFRWIKGMNGELIKEYYHRPIRPSWSPIFSVRRNKVPQSWALLLNHAIDDLYWDSELIQAEGE